MPVRTLLSLIAAAALGSAASACLPPPPGSVTPTDEERVRSAAAWATDIVYGVLVSGSHDDGPTRFRVLHVSRAH